MQILLPTTERVKWNHERGRNYNWPRNKGKIQLRCVLDPQLGRRYTKLLQFKETLKKQSGIGDLWLDEERMTGNIVRQMCRGINQSKLVIVFITQKYIEKVDGRGEKEDNDNCLLEFSYAANRKGGKKKLIAVVVEDICSDSSEWDGPIGMYLGNDLYYSLCCL